jgi:hypothetical protein
LECAILEGFGRNVVEDGARNFAMVDGSGCEINLLDSGLIILVRANIVFSRVFISISKFSEWIGLSMELRVLNNGSFIGCARRIQIQFLSIVTV